MAKASEIEKMFVGYDRGKVQVLEIYFKKERKEWTMKFKEGDGQVKEVGSEDRDFMEALFFEFGGNNPETCKTQSRFLELDGSWDSRDIDRLGHVITKITVRGQKSHRKRNHPYTFPEDVGEPRALKSNRTVRDEVVVGEDHNEKCSFTRSFSNPGEFDNLVRFLRTHDCLKDLKFTVYGLGTQSKFNGGQCVWERGQAGDGTSSMVLELTKINGTHFSKHPRKFLYDAADGMFDAPCKRVTMAKSKKRYERNICLFAVDDGKVDVSGYEPVVNNTKKDLE